MQPKEKINNLNGKSLIDTHPNICKFWDYEKNYPLLPEMCTHGTNISVWWVCNKHHSFKMVINDRTDRNYACPYCSNKKLKQGFNDLATTYPNIAKDWNYEKNGDLTPDKVIAGSRTPIWWKCDKGHEWIASLRSRKQGASCPYCSNQKILEGYNDFKTKRPDLAKEWNYARNKDILPIQIGKNSKKSVWWICSLGHEWLATPNNRNKGSGCPICYKLKRGILENASTV